MAELDAYVLDLGLTGIDPGASIEVSAHLSADRVPSPITIAL